MEQHRCFLGTPCQLSSHNHQNRTNKLRDVSRPTNKPWAKCLCILKSSLGRVLQMFRKNGVIEGDGHESSAGRQQTPSAHRPTVQAAPADLRAQADGSRRAPVQEAPADVCARAGSPADGARAPCGECRPACARAVRPEARRIVPASGASARPRCGSAGSARRRPERAVRACAQRAPSGQCCLRAQRRPCGLCRPARSARARAGSAASARAPRAGSACLRARMPGPTPCGQCLLRARARADSARLRGRAGRRQQTARAQQTAPADLCAHAWADHCRRARWPGPTTADARACLGRPLRTAAQAWADHCRCTSACEQACARAPGPAPADVGALGRTDGSSARGQRPADLRPCT
ncbi:UNVERIFIED_CONTAM: hypothetical protein Sindi_2894200 [Sesamum indicum]